MASATALRAPALTAAVEAVGIASPQLVEQLAKFLNNSRRLMVISGAGLSTESGIPLRLRKTGAQADSHQQFVNDPQKRYVLVSFIDYWRLMTRAEPNIGHRALLTNTRGARNYT